MTDPMDIEQRSAPRECGAKTRAGTPCKRHPVPGGKRCKLHGGYEPRALAKARANVQVAEAQKALEAQGYQPVTDPLSALQDVAGRQQVISRAIQQVLSQAAERDGLEAVAGQPISQWLSRALADESKTLTQMIGAGVQEKINATWALGVQKTLEFAGQCMDLARTTDLSNEQITSRVMRGGQQ